MANYGGKNQAFGVAGCDVSGLILTSVLPSGINVNLLADGSVTNQEFEYLDGVSSNIQQQIDNLVTGGTSFSAVAEATVNVNLGAPGTAIFDGVTLTNGQTLFLNAVASGGGQTNPAQAGLYTFNGSASPLTRLSSMSTWAEVVNSIVYVNAGGAMYGGTIWRNTNVAGGTINVTAVTYTQAQGAYVGGTGVTITGNMISIGQSVATTANVLFNTIDLTATSNFLSIGSGANTVSFTAPTVTGNLLVNVPNANSTMVIYASAPSNNFMTGVNSNGSIAYSPIASTQLSDVSASAATNAQLLISNGTSYAPQSFSGGATISNAGVVTLGNTAVTGQLLTGFSQTLGNISATDSILSAFDKIALWSNQTTATVVTNTTIPIGQTVTDVNADGTTQTAPDATLMVIGMDYGVYNIGSAITTIVAAKAGQSIGGNATFTISGTANSCVFTTDGVNLQLK